MVKIIVFIWNDRGNDVLCGECCVKLRFDASARFRQRPRFMTALSFVPIDGSTIDISLEERGTVGIFHLTGCFIA